LCSSWLGVAQNRHSSSRAGNRRINRLLHIMVIVQLRNDIEGRAYYRAARRQDPNGRALKRRRSDIVYRQLVADQKRLRQNLNETDKGGQAGAATGCSTGYRHVFPERLIVMRRRGGVVCLVSCSGIVARFATRRVWRQM
jgi:hypothetical protein